MLLTLDEPFVQRESGSFKHIKQKIAAQVRNAYTYKAASMHSEKEHDCGVCLSMPI